MYENIVSQSKWCDVKVNDIWRLASISKIEGELVTVYFDGWSLNKNRTICIHSPYIAPARMYTRGYTGQQSFPLRNWELDLNTMVSVENKINLYPKVVFNEVTAIDMMQLFRCDLYVLVDKIFFYNWKNDNNTITFAKISEFFTSIIQITINIFGKFSILLCQANNSTYSEDSYLTNTYVCYIECTYELILILFSIFGFDTRTNHFYENTDEVKALKFVDIFVENGGLNFLSKFFKSYENSVIFERKFYILVNMCKLYLLVLISNSKKVLKSQKIISISDLLDFMKKENFVKKLKEKEDKDYTSFIQLLESLIKLIPDMKNLKKYLTFIQELSGNNTSAEMMYYLNDISQNETGIFKKIGDMESKIKFLEAKLEEKGKLDQYPTQKNVIGEIRLNLDTNNAYANDEYAILSGIEFLLSNNNVTQCLKLIGWRKKIIQIANTSGWIVAKILASNTIKKFEVNENDIIEANLSFMENYSHVQQNLRTNDSSTNLINLYEKELLLSINSLIEENKKN